MSSTVVLRSSFIRIEQWHDYRPFGFRLASGDGEERPGCHLQVNAFGWYARIAMPPLIRPHERRVKANWDAATVERIGRDYWIDYTERAYGFSIDDGFLQVFLGRQSHDSSTEQNWCCHFPWQDWRHVRFSLYDLDGNHFWTQRDGDRIRGIDAFAAQRAAEDACPKAVFAFKDFDGEEINASTHLEERECRFGTKWCKWLSWFRRARIRRYLDIDFSAETGRAKGSWKGGTMGHSIEVRPGELHEAAFRRYCQEHEMYFLRHVS